MSKLLLSVTALLIASISQTSFASQGDSSTGCGLGWKVNNSMSLSGTTTRGSTNSTLGGPLGTTSGTSGCDRYSIVKNDMKVIHFVEANYDSLIRESAAGRGETLDGLATTLNCEPKALGSAMKANYSKLIQSEQPAQLLQQIESLSRSESMSHKCVSLTKI